MSRPRKLAARFGSAYTLPRLKRALSRLGVRMIPWQRVILRHLLMGGGSRTFRLVSASSRTMLTAARLIERLSR